jgi:hypothetical protein
MSSDLEQLRSWRTGHASRVLVLHGYDGAAGVTLTEFAAGQRRSATYDSTSTAALAVRAGRIPWKITTPGMPTAEFREPRAVRREPRRERAPKPQPEPKAPRVPMTPEQLQLARRAYRAKYRAKIKAQRVNA